MRTTKLSRNSVFRTGFRLSEFRTVFRILNSVFRIRNAEYRIPSWTLKDGMLLGILNGGRLGRGVLVFVLLLWSANSHALNVVIDPGHGGVDKGAVRGNLKEAEVVLQVSKLLEELIKKDPTMRASMTREKDETLSLQDRVVQATKADGDLLVSIHANASTDSRAKGIEFYFQNQLPPDEETLLYASQENQLLKEEAESESELSPSQNADLKLIVEDLHQQTRIRRSYQFAQSLIGHWPESVTSRNQVLRQAPFFIVSKSKMPSVLIEIGFISNPKEAKKLTSGEFQQEIAEKIYQGIKSYRDTIKK